MDQTKGSSNTSIDKVNIHPLVLLSVVDHYNRVAKDTDRRVVGILLGTTFKGTVEVTNSYAVPFEEDPKNPSTWYFDHNYHEAMYAMFRKVNAVERVVGWYSTGSSIRGSDLQIHEVVREYVSEPVFALATMRTGGGNPVRCYQTVLPVISTDSPNVDLEFAPLETLCAAEEAEEVGVEHVLRGVSNIGGETLSSSVSGRLSALNVLLDKLTIIHQYLQKCAKGAPADPQVLKNTQAILALVPDVTNPEFLRALQATQADNLMVLYVGHITRIVTGLHDLLKNKILNRDAQRDEEAKKALLLATKNPEEETANEEGENDMDTVGDVSAE